ncbi:MAG TPA: DUF5683 domain-containing protein [Bacteroidales bacterium]|nr:DUF5683 domain-containing protein [Bacteroidales bacterium]
MMKVACHPVATHRKLTCFLRPGTALLIILCILSSLATGYTPVTAQDTIASPALKTTTLPPKKHSAKKASIYSAVLPGLGQAYNHKYWKIPIIYAGFGAFAYFINQNYSEYQQFKEAYLWKISGDTIPIDNEYIYKYQTADQLKNGKNYYLRNFELTCILTGVWYVLNILDATVDAHLLDYDINEDLSVQLQPGIQGLNPSPWQPVAGVTMALRFK